MGAPTYTYTLTNGNTADASQVSQNFTDILNGVSDGTKDLSISALTVAGTSTLNGNINLGNASGDDLAITASLASTLAIKTNNTYGIGGATLGLSGIYLGAPSSRSTRITANQSLSASHTLVLPDGNGTSRYFMETDGSGNMTWVKPKTSPSDILNYGLSNAVAASALTMTFKGADGNSLSSTNPVVITFRNVTAGTGTPTELEITSNLTLTLSSGSTMGMASAGTYYLYWYVANDGGTARLGASMAKFDEGTVCSSTGEGGAGAADSNAVIYSTTAWSSKAIRCVARTKHSLTTAGTWDEAADEISLPPFKDLSMGVKAYRTGAGQSLNNTTFTKMALTLTTNDSHNAFDGTTNYRYTFLESGRFSFDLSMYWAASAVGLRSILIYKNGSAQVSNQTPGNVAAFITNFSYTDYYVVGDYVEMYCWQSSGGILAVGDDATDSYMTIARLPGL